jgi:hypothetical protein
VGTRGVEVAHALLEDSPEMILPEDAHGVETLASDTPKKPLADRSESFRARGGGARFLEWLLCRLRGSTDRDQRTRSTCPLNRGEVNRRSRVYLESQTASGLSCKLSWLARQETVKGARSRLPSRGESLTKLRIIATILI